MSNISLPQIAKLEAHVYLLAQLLTATYSCTYAVFRLSQTPK